MEKNVMKHQPLYIELFVDIDNPAIELYKHLKASVSRIKEGLTSPGNVGNQPEMNICVKANQMNENVPPGERENIRAWARQISAACRWPVNSSGPKEVRTESLCTTERSLSAS